MEKTLAALKAMDAQWKVLKEARPNEGNLGPHGHPSLTYSALDDIFKRWGSTIGALESKTRWLETGDAQVADYTLPIWINDLTGLIGQARNNAFHWLLQTDFFNKVVQTSQLIAMLGDRRAGVVRSIAKDVENRSVDELRKVVEAAPLVEAFTKQRPQLESDAQKVKDLIEKNEAAANSLSGSLEEMRSMRAEIEAAHSEIKDKRIEIEKLRSDANASRDSIETKASELDKRLPDLKAAVDKELLAADDARSVLDKALQDVRQQGLAGAFNDRSLKVRSERRIWGFVFVSAVLCLGVVAVVFAVDLVKFTYEALLVAMLRRVAIAAPLIWLGWYAARQLGRLGRVQEDYEYKAATALAFQSYKSEAEAIGNNELTAELLRRAIEAFGDNPVRLYDHAAAEPVTPSSDLLNKVMTEDNVGLIKRIISIAK